MPAIIARPTATASQTTSYAVLQASTMSTPIGPLTMLASDGMVVAGGFTDDIGALINGRLRQRSLDAQIEVVPDLGAITEALGAYFDGNPRALDGLRVEYSGGPFQQRVWAALRAIPAGQPTTYRQVAVQLGSERLARAVGMGCATNLISPIVPCHRVTHGTGRLAGYYWGLDRKRWLLDHEQRHAVRWSSTFCRARPHRRTGCLMVPTPTDSRSHVGCNCHPDEGRISPADAKVDGQWGRSFAGSG